MRTATRTATQLDDIHPTKMQHFLVGFSISAIFFCSLTITLFVLALTGKVSFIEATQSNMVMLGFAVGLVIALVGGYVYTNKVEKKELAS